MTVQEVKKLIRRRVRQELGSVPEVLFEELWLARARNLCEVAEECCEADLEGEVGTDYVDAMRLLLRGWQAGQQSKSAPAKVLLRNNIPRAEAPPVTALWDALPERDRQAMEQVWRFAYNALERHAEVFRERFTQGKTLTQSEAYEWVTAEENGCLAVLDDSEAEDWAYYVCDGFPPEDVLIALLNGREVTSLIRNEQTPLATLALFASINDMSFGLPARAVVLFVLTGQRLQPRIPVLLAGDWCFPLFPDYLSTEGVARAWKAFRYTGNARSWVLARYKLNEFASYEEARCFWNEVAPAEWRIGNYRAFQVLWTRAGGEREDEKPKAPYPEYSNEWADAYAEALDCFGIFPFLE